MDTETEDTLTFDDWTTFDDKFALRVQGDAMIGEHIRDGDFVVMQRQGTAKDGQIVAFRDDEGEIALRRYFRHPSGRVYLESANPDVTTIRRDSVEIIGVLVGVVRKY